jgi:hypothetical protein
MHKRRRTLVVRAATAEFRRADFRRRPVNRKELLMSYLLVRHKVRNVDQWKAVFDEQEDVRARAGIRTRFLFRNVDEPDEIVVVFEAGELATVRTFAASAELRALMQRGGVVDEPDVYFLE